MTENENVGTDQGSVDESKIEAEHGSLSRRGFLMKSALLSAPVIMTVASGPVWARNCTMSGRLSGNLSDSGPECPTAACSPGYWKQTQHLGSWSGKPSYTTSSFFNEAFGVAAFPDTATLLQVISGTPSASRPNDPSGSCWASLTQNDKRDLKRSLLQLAFHAVAALQNSLTLGTLGYPHSTDIVIQKFVEGFAAFNLCDKAGIETAKNYLEAPYLNVHFCPFGNDGTDTDQNIP